MFNYSHFVSTEHIKMACGKLEDFTSDTLTYIQTHMLPEFILNADVTLMSINMYNITHELYVWPTYDHSSYLQAIKPNSRNKTLCHYCKGLYFTFPALFVVSTKSIAAKQVREINERTVAT